ncbi:MAG: replication initiation protein [Maribacter sp.]|nr:replication initiation protein [Maribacter sp.]
MTLTKPILPGIEVVKLERHEVIKHSAAIHISNTLTHTQRMVSNVLLKNAFRDLLSNDRHQLKVSALAQAVDCNTRNIKGLKDILSVLVTTKLEWNVLDKDKKNIWGVSSLLAYAEIKNGVCRYEYSRGLRNIFSNPNIYARLNLLIQRQFKCGHSLAIWEYLMEFLCSKGFEAGHTDWISVEAFKRLLGVQNEPLYKEFKYVSQRLIKAPLKKINTLSDLNAEVKYERKNRRVIALRFKVSRKATYKLPQDVDLPSVLLDDGPVDTSQITEGHQGNGQVLDRLISFGLTEKQARKAITTHDECYITENLEIVEKNCRAGKVEKVPAYTMMALKEDYRPNKTFLDKEKEVETKEVKAKLEQQKRTVTFGKLKVEFEAKRLESALDALSKQERGTLENEFLESLKGSDGDVILKSYNNKGLKSIVVKSVFNVFAKKKLINTPITQKEFKPFIKSRGYKIGEFTKELKAIGGQTMLPL